MDLLEVLLHPFHRGTGLRAEERGQIVVAPLHRAFEDGTGVRTVPVGQVVVADGRCRAVRRSETGGETARQVQQCFRNVVAVVTEGNVPFCHRILDQPVVGFLQQRFKIEYVLQIMHRYFHLQLYLFLQTSIFIIEAICLIKYYQTLKYVIFESIFFQNRKPRVYTRGSF